MKETNHKTYYKDLAFQKKFGAHLKKIRQQKGYSQEELANELGFSQPHLANIELGKVNTSISHVAAFAKALGVEAKDLFDF